MVIRIHNISTLFNKYLKTMQGGCFKNMFKYKKKLTLCLLVLEFNNIMRIL